MNPYILYQKAIQNKNTRWLMIGATVAYLLWPVDLMPDILLGFGQIDDAVLVTMLVSELLGLAKNHSSKKEPKKPEDVEVEVK